MKLKLVLLHDRMEHGADEVRVSEYAVKYLCLEVHLRGSIPPTEIVIPDVGEKPQILLQIVTMQNGASRLLRAVEEGLEFLRRGNQGGV